MLKTRWTIILSLLLLLGLDPAIAAQGDTPNFNYTSGWKQGVASHEYFYNHVNGDNTIADAILSSSDPVNRDGGASARIQTFKHNFAAGPVRLTAHIRDPYLMVDISEGSGFARAAAGIHVFVEQWDRASGAYEGQLPDAKAILALELRGDSEGGAPPPVVFSSSGEFTNAEPLTFNARSDKSYQALVVWTARVEHAGDRIVRATAMSDLVSFTWDDGSSPQLDACVVLCIT